MNMYELKSHWAATYNRKQGCLKAVKLFAALMINRKSAIEHDDKDCLQIFGVYKTEEQAREEVSAMKELQK